MNATFCAKCEKNEATIHFTPVAEGKVQETVHLCQDCAPASVRRYSLSPKKPEGLSAAGELSVVGKQCEFCGKAARYGSMIGGRAVYRCQDCHEEMACIILDLSTTEGLPLKRSIEGAVSFITFDSPELHAWLEAVQLKAIEILNKRRRRA